MITSIDELRDYIESLNASASVDYDVYNNLMDMVDTLDVVPKPNIEEVISKVDNLPKFEIRGEVTSLVNVNNVLSIIKEGTNVVNKSKISIKENATCGDVIKAMFPDLKVRFVTESQIGVTFEKNQNYAVVFDYSWWNSKYEVENE